MPEFTMFFIETLACMFSFSMYKVRAISARKVRSHRRLIISVQQPSLTIVCDVTFSSEASNALKFVEQKWRQEKSHLSSMTSHPPKRTECHGYEQEEGK